MLHVCVELLEIDGRKCCNARDLFRGLFRYYADLRFRLSKSNLERQVTLKLALVGEDLCNLIFQGIKPRRMVSREDLLRRYRRYTSSYYLSPLALFLLDAAVPACRAKH